MDNIIYVCTFLLRTNDTEIVMF